MQLLRDHFEEFFEDVFEEFSQFGKIEEMNVMDNLSDQLVGNVYCMFEDEEGAAKAPLPTAPSVALIPPLLRRRSQR